MRGGALNDNFQGINVIGLIVYQHQSRNVYESLDVWVWSTIYFQCRVFIIYHFIIENLELDLFCLLDSNSWEMIEHICW